MDNVDIGKAIGIAAAACWNWIIRGSDGEFSPQPDNDNPKPGICEFKYEEIRSEIDYWVGGKNGMLVGKPYCVYLCNSRNSYTMKNNKKSYARMSNLACASEIEEASDDDPIK